MVTFLIIFLYFIAGVVLMGITLFLYKKNKVFHRLCEIIDVDFALEVDSFFSLSCFFGFLWPFAVLIAIICFPYAYIKYLNDNDWKIFEKKYYKCNCESCPFRKPKRWRRRKDVYKDVCRELLLK